MQRRNQTGRRSLFGLKTVYADVRKDATIKSNRRRGKYYRETVIEGHYVIVGEPHKFYLSHVTPTGETHLEITKVLFQIIEGTQLQNSPAIIRTDGTAVMTGKNAGCIACLEAKSGRSLQ